MITVFDVSPARYGLVETAGSFVAALLVHDVFSFCRFGRTLSFMHRWVPDTDARPVLCGRRQGDGCAEVLKSDRRPARVLRDVAFAVANQVPKEPEATPEVRPPVRCPSGTANSFHIAGLTGNARSATGAQCRSRGPWRRAEARQRTADSVSA
ncbi:MAG TPA: hypothetical protein VMV91_02280 [Rhodocyclaceae bacterium]|nr:hypothetical protein [Rhodocyclaceae bacterium]